MRPARHPLHHRTGAGQARGHQRCRTRLGSPPTCTPGSQDRTQRVLPTWFVRILASAGVLLFAGVGMVSLLFGAEFLNYSVLAHDPHHGQHYGILLVELGVLITVFGVMVTIFYFFAARGREDL